MSENSGRLAPEEIERRSFAIITAELGDTPLVPGTEAVVKRVIHTTADFEYVRNLVFSDQAIVLGQTALRDGCAIVTDTQMALAGINKAVLRAFGGEAHCLVADPEVAAAASAGNTTRSAAAVDKAARLWPEAIYVVGNAPTALFRICELVAEGWLRPRLLVGTPVGFVNVVESKERALASGVPHIVAKGRKGGSNVAAAICNALLYTCSK